MSFRSFVLCAAGAIMGYQLFCDPIVGYPNNGDFQRILGIYHMTPVCEPADCYFKFVVPSYRFDWKSEGFFEQASSEQLVVLPAILLNLVISKDGFLNIRLIGLAHAALWMLGFWLALPLLELIMGWKRCALAALLLIVYCDVVYVQYSNSFYMDTSAVIFLFLSLILWLRLLTGTGSKRVNAAGLVIAILLGAMAKTQHALLFAVILFFLLAFRREYWPFGSGYFDGAVAVILGGIVYLFATVPPGHKLVTFYSVVFDGILPQSSEPTKTLSELGLPSEYAKYSGTHAYSKNSGMQDAAFQRDYTPRASEAALMMYEVMHPVVAASLIFRGLSDASIQRYPGYGTLPKSGIHPDRVYSRAWSLWSTVKRALLGNRGWAMFAYLVAGCAALCFGVRRRWPKRRDALSAAAGLCLIAMMALSIATLFDVVDTLRHLHIYAFLTDTIAVAAVGVWLSSGHVNIKIRPTDTPSVSQSRARQ